MSLLITRRTPLVVQELLTFSSTMGQPRFQWGSWYSIFYVHICRSSFVRLSTRPVSCVEQELLPSQSTRIHPRCLVWFVLLYLQFSVYCLVDRCKYFFIWPLCCLSFDLPIIITPLVFSNSSSYHPYICTTSTKYQYQSRPTPGKVNALLELL